METLDGNGYLLIRDPTTSLTTKGDLLTYDTGMTRLPVGSDNQVLTADSSQAKGIKWSGDITDMTLKSTFTTKGDIIAASAASTPARVGVGSNNQVLTADSAQSSGVKWSGDITDMNLKSTLTTKGDIYAASAASTPARLGVGADTQIIVADSSQTTGLAWSDPPRSNAYYRNVGTSPLECWYNGGASNLSGAGGATTGAPATGTLLAFPFVSPRGGTIDRLAFNVTTVGGAGSKARVGIYDSTSDTNLYPNNIVVDGGEFDTSAVGGTGVKSATISKTFAKNKLYWFVYLCGTAAPTVRCLTIAELMSVLGTDSSLGGNRNVGLTVALAYGALPASFTAGATFVTAVPVPSIAVRYSA